MPGVEMLEGRMLLSTVKAKATPEPAAIKPPTTQAQKFPPYNISLFITSPTDGSGSNQVFSPNVAVGGFAPPYSVVWLASGLRPGYFLSVTQANGNGDFAFPVQIGSGTTVLQAFAENSTQDYSNVAQVPVTLTNPIVAWDSLALHEIEVQGLPAPEAARDLAVLHAAQYDAVADITNPSSAYQVHLTAPKGASAAAAADSAAATVLTALFPSQASDFTSAEKTAIDGLPKTPSVAAGQTFGQQVADQTLANRANDGSNVAAGTPTSPSTDVSTQYATVTPFVLASESVFQPPAPPAPGSSTFDQALAQVAALGGVNSTTRTADQTAAALFWNEGSTTSSVTDPVHWNAIADQLAGARKNSLATDARLFAELDFALADAGIASSVSQATYKEARPGTVLQQSDPTFVPLLETPSSPSYVSDNAAYGASAAAVLTSSFGPNFKFTDLTEGNPTEARTFASLDAAATEDGMSRVWGGINFSFDVQAGSTLGTQIGKAVLTTFQKKK
jgi:PAP2 superfamily